MKLTYRLLSFIMALLMLAAAAVACADSTASDDSTTAATTTIPDNTEGPAEEETLFEMDDLDEKYYFDQTMTIFMWNDYTMNEFYSELSGDIIEDAIYFRNIAVEDRLDIELNFIGEKGDYNDYTKWIKIAENDWQSDNVFDIYAGYSRSAPLMTLKGMTVNLLDHKAFNEEKPWWPKALTTECTINDKLYFCSGDISTNLLWMMTGTFYNKELYNQFFNGQKTPMDMVEDNEWTMETFFTMVSDIYRDDGNGVKDNADTFGYVLVQLNIDAFQTAAGVISIEKDNEKGIRIADSWNSQRCADVCELVGNLILEEGVLCNTKTSIRNVFYDKRAMFITDRLFIVAGKDTTSTGKIEFSYGLVPQPKFTVDQEAFHTNVGHPFTMYAVNSRSSNIEAAVTALEAFGSENHRTVTPTVFEVAMKIRYTDDPQTSDMYDLLRDGISFDIGRLYSTTFDNATSDLFKTTAISGNPSGLLTNIKMNVRVIENGIDTIMDYYKK